MQKTLKVIAWIVGIVAVIIGVMRLTFLGWWSIPTDDPLMSASMAPNLAGGDFVLLYRATPKYGDLVRCVDPEEPQRWVVGRVLGEPGDKIELTNSHITVNGKITTIDMTCAEPKVLVESPSGNAPEELWCQTEVAQGHKHNRAVRSGAAIVVEGKRQVSEGNLFLVSDNRAFPYDSRVYGAIPKSSCTEQIFFRVVSAKGFGDVASRFLYIR